MPSEKVLIQKQQLVTDLAKEFSEAAAGVLVDYKGISVANDTKLRKELREAEIDYKVVKNSLLSRAVKDSSFEALGEVLVGNTAVAFSFNDPVAAARILNKYAEGSRGKFVIKAGFIDGEVLDKAGVERLAKLPNKEQLLVQLLSVLNGNLRGLAFALNAIAEQKDDGSAPPAEAAPAVEAAPEAVTEAEAAPEAEVAPEAEAAPEAEEAAPEAPAEADAPAEAAPEAPEAENTQE